MKIYTYRDFLGNSAYFAERCAEHYLGRPVTVSYYGSGKPYVVDEDIYISVSHTGRDIVIAVSDSEVGIDIENKKYRHYQPIAERFLEEECRDINDFYLKWTRYEARYKHGGDDGEYYSIDIFDGEVMTVYSRDTDYVFVPMDIILD